MESPWGCSMGLSIYLQPLAWLKRLNRPNTLGLLILLGQMAQVAQCPLAFGPLGPPLGMFGLGEFVSAKTRIVTRLQHRLTTVMANTFQSPDVLLHFPILVHVLLLSLWLWSILWWLLVVHDRDRSVLQPFPSSREHRNKATTATEQDEAANTDAN
jgi:hypothetical protein